MKKGIGIILAAAFIAASTQLIGFCEEDINQALESSSSEQDKRPSYVASDYIKCESYSELRKEFEQEIEAETEPESELVGDLDVLAELYQRAEAAGISTDKALDDEDAAVISDQEYQTLDEYKAYLKEVLTEKALFSERAEKVYEFVGTVAENSELSGVPVDVQEYDNKIIESHLEERAEMFGTSLDQIKENGDYETFKNTAFNQNEEYMQIEMLTRYVAEKEGITLEDGDRDDILDYYGYLYGTENADNMWNTYSESQIETETLMYKIIKTLF